MTLYMKLQEARAEAEEKGRQEERERVAIELLVRGFSPLEAIAKVCSLPLEEVKALKARIDKGNDYLSLT